MNKNLLLIGSIIALAGCGSSSSGGKKIDMKSYLPTSSMTKEYTRVRKIDGKLTTHYHKDSVAVNSNSVSIKEDGKLNRLFTIKNDEIDVKYLSDVNHTKVITRKLNKDDTVSDYLKADEVEILKIGSQRVGEKHTKIEEKCTVDSMINRYEKFFFEYINYDDEHDIMKIKCITKKIIETKIDKEYADSVSYTNSVIESKDDISYVYLQKGLGMIATINDDCLASKSPDIIDDTLSPKKCLDARYEYDLYQPAY